MAADAARNGAPPPNEETTRKSASVRHILTSPVFAVSALLIGAFLAGALLFTEAAASLFESIQAWIISRVGWFYPLAVATFLVFSLGLALSSFGRIKLGPPDSEPEFGFVTWFAMLFSAGMGIGLMFYGVAEPVLHFSSPPTGEGGTMSAAREALPLTLLHWGMHAWAIYAVVGLAIAYFSFRHGLPVAIRSALYPLLGERIKGWTGHAVDSFAVLGTMFGVATSLGFGVMQINAGLAHLFGLPVSLPVQFILIALVTAAATLSVASGLGRGIRRLSELNIVLAVLLLAFVLFAGPTEFLMQALVQNIGAYLGDIVRHTFNLYAYQPNDWIGEWTLFYWGWWISWAPFVGVFIARVSRGRSIRQFVMGVLGVPTLLAAVWFTAFGDTAIFLDIGLSGEISRAVEASVPTALFVFFEQLPWSGVMSMVATLMVVVFFVTSADSGALVMDMMSHGGVADPPLWSRIFWAVTSGCVAAALLAAGGLGALQTAAIASGLPFAVIMLFMCFGLLRGLQADVIRAGVPRLRPLPSIAAGAPWRQRLRQILSFPNQRQVEAFLERVVDPGLRKVAEEIRTMNGLEATVEAAPSGRALVVLHGQERDFAYEVRIERRRRPQFGLAETGFEADEDYFRAAVYVQSEPQHYDLVGLTEAQVISDVLAQYDSHVSGLGRKPA